MHTFRIRVHSSAIDGAKIDVASKCSGDRDIAEMARSAANRVTSFRKRVIKISSALGISLCTRKGKHTNNQTRGFIKRKKA